VMHICPNPFPAQIISHACLIHRVRERNSEKIINTGSSEKVQLEIIHIPYHGGQKFFLPSKCVQKEMEQI